MHARENLGGHWSLTLYSYPPCRQSRVLKINSTYLISNELGEPRKLLKIFYILHMFITGIGTAFPHYAELIVNNFMFHSTL
jgi:hypothetical protein